MLTRKEMKKRAKHSLKKHYLIFVALCVIASFIGSEFSTSLDVIKTQVPVEETGTESDSSLTTPEAGLMDIFDDIATGNLEAGEKAATKNEDYILTKSKESDNKILGRTRGVLSMVVNSVTSGSFLVRIANGLQSMVRSKDVAILILITLSMIFVFLIWFFIINVYQVISRRMFLEGRCYDKLPIYRSLYLLKVKRWTRAACTMFVTSLFGALWWLTIIGGIIKYFSYFMVPYIVAENPDIKPLEAIRLSRQMMKGHKWECFFYQLTFIGWHLLGFCTLGLSRILFSNPYIEAFYTEYYVQLRQLAAAKNIPNADLLNDQYLFEKANDNLLNQAYAEVVAAEAIPETTLPELKGIQKFIADIFGVTFKSNKYEQAYEEDQARRIRYVREVYALRGLVYPTKLSPFPSDEKRQWIGTTYYVRHYSIWSIIMLFFIMAFVGWVWEVSLHLISDGVFVNRGVLHGPWLPIYGTGSIIILLLLNKLRKWPALEFISAIVVCGCVEYFTAYYLEMTHNGQKWWDYSGYFLNLDGRICAEGLLAFGLGGMLIVYVLAPVIDNLLKRIPHKILIPICLVLLVLYCWDQHYSSKHPNTGKGITDYAQASIEQTASTPDDTPPDRGFYPESYSIG